MRLPGSPESSTTSSAAPTKRGLAVKRSGGLKNPLHAKPESAPPPPPQLAPSSPPKPALLPVVKKQPVKADDFFEDFGFATSSKPKSTVRATASKPSTAADAARSTADKTGSHDDWGDDDLDDLFDD